MAEILNIAKNRAVQKVLEDGTRLTFFEILRPRPRPDSTAFHEAAHVLALGRGNIVEASVIPEGNSLGHVVPIYMTPAGAMAPGGLGYSGTGWDRFLTENFLRADPKIAAAVGRSLVLGQPEEHYQVAVALAEKGIIGPAGVDEAYKEAERVKLGIRPVQVEVVKPSGEKRIFLTQSFRWQVDLPLAV